MKPVPQVLYRHYRKSDNALLYVGISVSRCERALSHITDKEWGSDSYYITIHVFPDRESVERAEVEAIDKENPIYNIVRSSPYHGTFAPELSRDESLEVCQSLSRQIQSAGAPDEVVVMGIRGLLGDIKKSPGGRPKLSNQQSILLVKLIERGVGLEEISIATSLKLQTLKDKKKYILQLKHDHDVLKAAAENYGFSYFHLWGGQTKSYVQTDYLLGLTKTNECKNIYNRCSDGDSEEEAVCRCWFAECLLKDRSIRY